MKLKAHLRAGTVVASLILGIVAPLPSALAQDAESTVQNAQNGINLGVGKGTLVRLPRAMSDVFIANQKVADVQVRSSQLLYVFGVGAGETSLYATDNAGRVVYSATVRVAQNIDQIKAMLGLAMPGAAIDVTPMNGMVLLSGTVASPSEVEEASRLVQSFVGKDQVVVNKLKTAMPVQVNLQVKFAEVSRDLVKELGTNIESLGTNDGFTFGIGRGRDIINDDGQFVRPETGTSVALAGKLLGIDVNAMIDALETDGFATTLAEPNLTALSGETATFLAGGEFPIAVSDGDGGISIEFKEYGVGLAFTPTVLDGKRISLRVRPEVSELSEAGAIRLSGTSIPGIITRRAETTVELGSGQSFMIGGLMRNRTNSSTDKTPLLGNLPVIGALFKSDRFQRNETELVIIVTPYLVKPVSADKIRLPTDGYQAPTDLQRWLLGSTFEGKNQSTRPQTRVVPAQPKATTVPSPVGGSASSPQAGPAAPGFSVK